MPQKSNFDLFGKKLPARMVTVKTDFSSIAFLRDYKFECPDLKATYTWVTESPALLDNVLESADVETVRSGRISSKIRVSEFISNDNSSAFNKTNCVIIRDREKLTFIEIQLPGHLPDRRAVNRISLICKLRKSEELQWLRTITRVSEGEFFILQLG